MSITVTQLVGYIKNKFDTDPNLQGLLVSGEISNFHRQLTSGHCYFTLKDEHAQIACVMFRSAALSLEFEPKNGDKVLIKAKASVFEQSGQMQLYVFFMKLDGQGDLFQQYEILKKKLANEGYFESSHKKELKSRYLSDVCVLVGDKSAAMSDIRTCFARRWPLCHVDYVPTLVQGKEAASDIISKLIDVDKKNYEVIILARGGGSFEDLFCFNDENLVKTIYSLNTFIVTGIGHEQDFTLADFVADMRAPTPTAAVELVTVNLLDVKEELHELIHSECFMNPSSILERKQMMLDYYSSRLLNFTTVISRIRNNIDTSVSQMSISIHRKLKEKEIEISSIEMNLHNLVKEKIHDRKIETDGLSMQMNHLIEMKYNNYRSEVSALSKLLSSYSKDNVLKRGYAIVQNNGQCIKNLNELKSSEIDIEFIDGIAKAEVKEKIWKQ